MATEESSAEGLHKFFIYVEAPEFLAEGQNFYDQQPFDDIFKTTSTEEEVDRLRLQAMLTHYLNAKMHGRPDREDTLTSEQAARAIIQGTPPFREVKVKASEGLDYNFIRGFRKLGNTLQDLPFWLEYFRDFFNSRIFTKDGSFYSNPARRIVDMPPSYGYYASKALDHDMRIRALIATLVATEAFPQGQYQSSPEGVNVGEKPVNRRWRILKASELVKFR